MKHSQMNIGRTISGILLVAALSISLCGCKNKFLFYPHKYLVATPAAAGYAYEDVTFNTEDGIALNGWWVGAPAARGTVLFCHGNGGNISYLLDTIHIYHKLNLNVFVFDYRGYGKSGGIPSEEGTYQDAKAAWRYLLIEKKIIPEKIILIGRSLGGSIVAWLARENTPGALILESTFTTAAEVANRIYPAVPGRLIFGNTYNTIEYILKAKCPILVVHSRDDDLIPYEMGERLYKTAPEPKDFLVIHGFHNSGFIESVNDYAGGIDRFLTRFLK